jgi:dTDP-4-amino-4,6-dideoxygalactose transaminase
LDEIQAAILRVKLKYLDQWNEERRRKANLYTEQLSPLLMICPSEKRGVQHVYHLYAIQTSQRDSLQAFLKKKGIDTLIHYPIPIPLQKAYQEMGYRKEDFPLTDQWSRKILSLPFFPEMKESEMEEVARQIKIYFMGDRSR